MERNRGGGRWGVRRGESLITSLFQAIERVSTKEEEACIFIARHLRDRLLTKQIDESQAGRQIEQNNKDAVPITSERLHFAFQKTMRHFLHHTVAFDWFN